MYLLHQHEILVQNKIYNGIQNFAYFLWVKYLSSVFIDNSSNKLYLFLITKLLGLIRLHNNDNPSDYVDNNL